MSEIEEYAKYNIELASDELSKDGEISNYAKCIIDSANYFKNNSYTLKELLRLKEEENKQLQQDKAELVEALKALVKVEHERGGTLGVSGSFNYPVPEGVFIKAKKLLEKHK